MTIKKAPYEVWITIGLYGIAITEFDEPEGILELHLETSGIHEWYDWLIEPLAGDLETGQWHLKGTITASEDDCKYTVDYAMPVTADTENDL